MRNFEFSEVVRWYEKQLGRSLTEAEKATIRSQCVINNNQIPNTKDLRENRISLCGLKYEETERRE